MADAHQIEEIQPAFVARAPNQLFQSLPICVQKPFMSNVLFCIRYGRRMPNNLPEPCRWLAPSAARAFATNAARLSHCQRNGASKVRDLTHDSRRGELYHARATPSAGPRGVDQRARNRRSSPPPPFPANPPENCANTPDTMAEPQSGKLSSH
jgi:hypothetical protein